VQAIGIVGGGAWGTALGCVSVRAGRASLLWAREAEVAEEINAAGRNSAFLPGIALEPGLHATTNLADLADREALLLAAPAQHLRRVAGQLAPHLAAQTPLLICAKGIEESTGRLLSEVLAETLPSNPVAVLSGPTFAGEVAGGLPAAVTLACADHALGERLVAALGSETFRPYYADDVIGAQIGGAVKNVLAIACGIVVGLELGENARAALITRGLAEMRRFALAKGARRETLSGLSGVGDLILTCSSQQSRNFSLGHALGEGRSLAEILGQRRSVAEGVYTAKALAGMGRQAGVEMPIAEGVAAILHAGAEVGDVMRGLLRRAFKREEP